MMYSYLKPLFYCLFLVQLLACAKSSTTAPEPGNNQAQGPSLPMPISPSPPPTGPVQQGPPLATIQCGQVITASMTVANDLDCSQSAIDFGLLIQGSGIIVDGGGHQLKVGSANANALIVKSPNAVVSGFQISGTSVGTGIWILDASGSEISGNTIANLDTGIRVTALAGPHTGLVISKNTISTMASYGVFAAEDSEALDAPKITGNKISGIGDTAIHIAAKSLSLDNSNTLSGAKDGIYLSGGAMVVTGLDVSAAEITGTPLMISHATSATITGGNFSDAKSVAINNTGIQIYDVRQTKISNVAVTGREVGIKVACEICQGASVDIESSQSGPNAVFGLWVTSYDGSAYDQIQIINNDLRGNPSGQALKIPSSATSSYNVANNLLTNTQAYTQANTQ